jgi:tRNA(fMet)-specific endonuclease VapC
MIAYVLDTDIFSLFRSGHPVVTRNVTSHPITALAVTAINVEESLAGWYSLIRRARRPPQLAFAYGQLAVTVTALAQFTILNFDLPAIARFEQLRQRKLKVGTQDLRIAAIALEHGATVATRNLADFQLIPGLAVVDWSV